MTNEDNQSLGSLFRETVLHPLYGWLASLDPKIVATAATFAATYVVVQLLGLDLDDTLVTVGTVKVTWAAAIAFAAAHVAGYYKANIATIFRAEQPDGNPDEALVKEKLGKNA